MAFSVGYQDAGPNRFWIYRTFAMTQNAQLDNGDTPPTGFGDVHLLAFALQVDSAATLALSGASKLTYTNGVRFLLKDPATALSVLLGGSELYAYSWTATPGSEDSLVSRLVELQRPVLWRSQFSLFACTGALDTNVAPTAQATIMALVSRLRER